MEFFPSSSSLSSFLHIKSCEVLHRSSNHGLQKEEFNLVFVLLAYTGISRALITTKRACTAEVLSWWAAHGAGEYGCRSGFQASTKILSLLQLSLRSLYNTKELTNSYSCSSTLALFDVLDCSSSCIPYLLLPAVAAAAAAIPPPPPPPPPPVASDIIWLILKGSSVSFSNCTGPSLA